jgi:hypothetical protein
MKITAGFWTVLFFLGAAVIVVLAVVTGRAKYVSDLLLRHKIKQLDREEEAAVKDLERLQREGDHAKQELDAAKQRAVQAKTAVEAVEREALRIPADRRADAFNDWWDSRRSSTDKSGL